MRKLFRIIKNIVLLSILAVVILITAVFVMLSTKVGSNFVSAKVSKALPGTLVWDGLVLNPFSLKVTVTSFQALTPDGETVISVGSTYLNVSLKKILKGQVVVTDALIEDVYVKIDIDSSNTVSLATAFVDEEKLDEIKRPFDPDVFLAEGLVPIVVDTLVIKNAQVLFIHQLANIEIETKEVSIGTRADLKRLDFCLSLFTPNVSIEIPAYKDFYSRLDLQVAGTLKEMHLSKLLLKNETSEITLSSTTKDLLFPSRMTTETILDVQAGLAHLGEALSLSELNSGELLIRSSISDKVADPTVALHLSYDGDGLLKVPFHEVSFALYNKKRIGRIDSLSLKQKKGGQVSANLSYDIQSLFPKDFFTPIDKEGLSEVTYSLDALLNNLSYKIAPEQLSLSQGRGVIKLQGAGVDLASATVAAELDLSTEVHLNKKNFSAGVKGVARAGKGETSLSLLNVFYNNQKLLELNGTLSFPKDNLSLTATLDTVSLAMVGEYIHQPLTGKMSGMVSAQGAIKTPSFTAQLKGQDVAYDMYRVDSLSFIGKTRANKGEVASSINLYLEDATVQLISRLDLFKPTSYIVRKDPLGEIDFSVQSVGLDLIHNDMSGTISAQGSYTGWYGKGYGQVDASLDSIVTPWVQGKAIFGTEVQDSLVTLTKGVVTLGDKQNIYLNGSYGLAGDFNASVTSDTLAIESIAVIADAQISGRAVLDIHAEGTPEKPSVRGGVFADRLAYKDIKVDSSLRLEAELLHKSITATLSGLLNTQASYNLDDGGYDATLDLDRFNLAPILSTFLGGSYEGFVSVAASIKGDSAGLQDLSASIPELEISRDSLELLRVDTIGVAYENSTVVIKAFQMSLLEKGYLEAGGEYSLSQGVNNLTVDTKIPLLLVEQFSDAVSNVEGLVEIGASLTGTTSKPIYSGKISFSHIGMLVNTLDQRVHDFSGDMTLTGDQLLVDSISGYLDEGQFVLFGDAKLHAKGVDTANIKMKLLKFRVQEPSYGEMEVDGTIALHKQVGRHPQIVGIIEILDGLYYKDIRILPQASGAMKGVEVLSLRSKADKKRKDSSRINLDIKILPRGAIVVDNNLAYMEVLPDLKVIGNLRQPVLEGRARIAKGEITYLQKIFEIQKGVIDFTNPYRISSNFDIQATAEIDQYKIILKIEGDPENNLKFLLSSQPALSDDDIVSLMIFGKTGQNVGVEGSGAAMLFLNQLANAALENSGIPIDKLAVDIANTGGFKLTVGQELSRKLTAEISVDTRDNEVVQRGDLRYRFFENFSLRGYGTTKGDAGVDLEVRFERR